MQLGALACGPGLQSWEGGWPGVEQGRQQLGPWLVARLAVMGRGSLGGSAGVVAHSQRQVRRSCYCAARMPPCDFHVRFLRLWVQTHSFLLWGGLDSAIHHIHGFLRSPQGCTQQDWLWPAPLKHSLHVLDKTTLHLVLGSLGEWCACKTGCLCENQR